VTLILLSDKILGREADAIWTLPLCTALVVLSYGRVAAMIDKELDLEVSPTFRRPRQAVRAKTSHLT
jgi:hypothetical protein